MLTAAIETSGSVGGIALLRDGECLVERTLSRTGRRHARTLIVELRRMFDEQGVAPRDIDVTAVSIGPGSFTGLRVGVVCAKTFAYATGCALVAVDTFQAVAMNAPLDVSRQIVIGDAQRGGVFVGRYERDADGFWQPVASMEVTAFEDLLCDLKADDVVSGPGLASCAADLAGRCRLLPDDCRRPFARSVGIIGGRRFAAGETAEVIGLEPFYLRRSGAEEKLAGADSKSPENQA